MVRQPPQEGRGRKLDPRFRTVAAYGSYQRFKVVILMQDDGQKDKTHSGTC
jgi:hypothetical protein